MDDFKTINITVKSRDPKPLIWESIRDAYYALNYDMEYVYNAWREVVINVDDHEIFVELYNDFVKWKYLKEDIKCAVEREFKRIQQELATAKSEEEFNQGSKVFESVVILMAKTCYLISDK